MDIWIDIRRKARDCHQRALAITTGDRRAASIIAAALSSDDLEMRRIAFGPGLLGSLDRASRLVNIAEGQDPLEELVVIAHEIGHYHLHRDPHNDVTAQPMSLGGDPVDSGAGKVEGYSPRERKETQADVFAGEFLCPSDWLREQYVVQGKRPTAIAAELGLPAGLVMNQMIRALLLPPLRPAAPENRSDPGYTLDEGQLMAATWDKGPLLVDAGPGTGKTRTLVSRIKYLLDKGSPPGSFLALTFSNKAAEEMRERLSVINPEAAVEMWVGTFHAFGLELLTKWPSTVGRTSNVQVLDQTASLAILEDNLEKLPLRYYQNLYEPAYELVPLLRMISRCKDELIEPVQYRAAADAALKEATSDEEREIAERLQEVAEVYRIYEDELRANDAVDFGDLIRLALELVQKNADVQKYIAGFKHILVDEFQDVNSASEALLRAMCSPAADIWVVADQRQSIYRFRGAEPLNVSRFTGSFGGTRCALKLNYRSAPAIVRVFENFSTTMGHGSMSGVWKAERANSGEALLTITPTLSAEGEAIRNKIEDLRNKGVPYRDQAVLARSHLTLSRITSILEELGVPLLYLGDLFERNEIRDLLSLLALGAESGAVGLLRVAALPDYQVSTGDSLEFRKWSHANGLSFFDALNRVSEIEQLSDEGRAGLVRLARDLDGLSTASPWTFLTTWLFERSDYLRPMLMRGDSLSQQQLVAIYQLLKVCSEYAGLGHSSRRRFLARIRRIEALSEDTSYRAISSEGTDVDAIRVMTIHGSKGLEFPVVHLPALATGYMPSTRRGSRVPAPPLFPQLAMDLERHDAEEECLFFVAASRARDCLSLSRAEQYTPSRRASESRFLPPIVNVLTSRRFQGSSKLYSADFPLDPPRPRDCYSEIELDLYMKCPIGYRYEVIQGLRGGTDDSAYIRFHRCVYVTVGWLERQRQNGNIIGLQPALDELGRLWKTDGPRGHAFERYYRQAAESMVAKMVETIAGETGEYDHQEWIVPVGLHKIAVTPDRVLISDSGISVQRIRTGRKTKTELERPIYALLRRGAALRYPSRISTVEIVYLSTGERVQVPTRNDGKLLAAYSDAISGIERGEFQVDPKDARRCPNCPCYFMCGIY